MNTKDGFRQSATLLIAVMAMFLTPIAVSAQGSQIDSAIVELASDLATTLEGLGEDQVLIGAFAAPAVMQNASAGAGIIKRLTDALSQKRITISSRAKFAIQGSYKRMVNHDGRVEIVIRGEFENNQTGQSVGQFEKVISAGGEANVENLSSLFGLAAEVPTDVPSKKRERALLESMQSPHVYVDDNTALRTSSDSPYAIEILTWRGDPAPGIDPRTLPYTPSPVSLNEGHAVVPIDRGDVYAIRLINDSPRAAAISISIDGLSLFSFANQDHRHVILERRSSAIVYGWYRTSSRSDSFRVTSYADSAVSELGGNPDGLGIISAAFRQAWDASESIPDDEFAARLLASRGGNATGRGASVVQNYKPWAGHVGAIRNVISVRYSRSAKTP